MNEVSSWSENNWYALGSLLTQFAFLAGIWFARNFLKTIRASQEQVGALVILSIASEPSDDRRRVRLAGAPFAEANSYWLTPAEMQTASLATPTKGGSGRLALVRCGLVCWLQAPMNAGQDSKWRRMINWLQRPAAEAALAAVKATCDRSFQNPSVSTRAR
jgi:hypothetical protein